MPNAAGKYTENELRDMKIDGIISVECNSSCVDRLSYDLLTSVCVVTLTTGTDVAYMNFPFSEFVEFVNADSIGSHFNYFVKGHYIKAY